MIYSLGIVMMSVGMAMVVIGVIFIAWGLTSGKSNVQELSDKISH